MRRKIHVGVAVDFEDEQDVVQHCQHCASFNVISKLGPRQVRGQEEPGPDWDNFKQCPLCGTIYGLYEVKKEQSVSGFTQTTDDPFESQKGVVMSLPKRNSKEGRKARARRERQRELEDIKDLDIRREVAEHGSENVKVVYDSNPD